MLDKVTQIETIKYDRDVSYSYAASRLSTHWTNHNMAWSDFMQKLAQTVRTKEDLTEYNKMSKSEQADIKRCWWICRRIFKRRETACWSSHESFNANT